MIENGSNPEALAAIIKEMRKESFSINNTDLFVKYFNLEKMRLNCFFLQIYIIKKLNNIEY
jgi:hypothetical protein